tara:strand:+ start:4212 stop:4700 length:489 start_codon:yes stop_codon:yes gene_type:complete
MSDDIRKCMDNTRIGFEISSNNLIKNGSLFSLVILYWVLFSWSYEKGYENIDKVEYASVIETEKAMGIILGITLMFGWIILPFFNLNFISNNNVLIYGVFGLIFGVTTMLTSINVLDEDKKLYGENVNVTSSFKAWSQVRMIIFSLFNVAGVLLINKGMNRV